MNSYIGKSVGFVERCNLVHHDAEEDREPTQLDQDKRTVHMIKKAFLDNLVNSVRSAFLDRDRPDRTGRRPTDQDWPSREVGTPTDRREERYDQNIIGTTMDITFIFVRILVTACVAQWARLWCQNAAGVGSNASGSINIFSARGRQMQQSCDRG